MDKLKIVLGIETSCDETAVAIVNSNKEVLSHKILSQQEHAAYGGVVPEIASRAHINYLYELVGSCIEESQLCFNDIDAIAVTAGPGLIGGLIVGIMMAKAISSVTGKPIIEINHLEAHALIIRMFYEIDFPFLLLIMSGGHCQFLVAYDVRCYYKLGSSLDDSLGEVFDKVARMLNLGYPGGPIIEEKSLLGDSGSFTLPRALTNRPGCDFSFSGLKTAVRNIIAGQKCINHELVCNISASFQDCVGDILVNRINNAIVMSKDIDHRINKLVVTGGVAANKLLRNRMSVCANDNGFEILYPPSKLCTDNGVMIGWAGIENLAKGYVSNLNFFPRARWPLENLRFDILRK
ncbi:putative metalloendopeptidase, glycoprotease family [Ehrlichia chaffeensis str. Arkansas]|uniref:tRNA N6-adenosine threonylcarbamoyltransferase n=1 Tax=Ehrlichia chaffeensis (strain ATCC CRL-10679 / Arkansas) TaxID=205920 RepID=TSAD_EHRCR|nr:tRNA (adenosine(37)-N6)-threonylcarbamoyltransferase complex transferase subunit TsaD [Ehrlichia chaffeensis]Q2GGH9.1 RecName: Full=tRNA N6-adenosine threonylcarbamoyltransferase; AltName: Full=N6-L-threonylcarbamoyladenine synthase; Short=t(6)A synthase; AltName: Full=t(6)A37 threonylcarbamoyladenosine biosynthesis protein TsaD; AltName: Full=tRNA threonylcarbamoyladenosine biosynthesis protein TsaD [Ehrlichia chaffeensis str. Arkansas]ABD44618.1 putative metalloendopeptidase, glycoprotease f